MEEQTTTLSATAFVPTPEDLSAKGAEQFNADLRAQGKRVTRDQFTAGWMAQAIHYRTWSWFDVRTSATLEALYGKGARA